MSLVPNLPPSLKPIQDFLVKAKQFEKVDPVVSHFCKVYALEKGLQVRDKNDKSTIEFLMPMMDELEKNKAEYGKVENPKMQVELCALKVFQKADDAYYGGKADLSTVKAFRAANTLMDVCRQWGDLESDIQEKYLYAKVKAAEIFKAHQEGRVAMPPQPEEIEEIPMAPPPADEDDGPPPPPPDYPPPPDMVDPPSAPDAGADDLAMHFPPPPSSMPPPPSDLPDLPSVPPSVPPSAPPPVNSGSPPPVVAMPVAPAPAPAPAAVPRAAVPSYGASKTRSQISTNDMVLAEKNTKFALSALQFDDVDEAVKNLKSALKLLTQ
eukprot:CAMPEP_0184322410 /NCGR_PEP_ID=MMETSP1049-20130417/124332_1 /TAXON_ID=77928 /ORGANISM="Proteomonas sulcata, Strain CCMP704" /LENGTH=322 /DNA_ID=CAMNT_0026643541 /DNA_START=169 /DNA_END=1137 /DNA_ORIENTATION=-